MKNTTKEKISLNNTGKRYADFYKIPERCQHSDEQAKDFFYCKVKHRFIDKFDCRTCKNYLRSMKELKEWLKNENLSY